MGIDRILSLRENNKSLYDKLFKNFLNNETLYMATNNMREMSNPVVIPIVNTEEVAIQIFETKEMIEEYRKTNMIEITEVSLNEVLLVLDKLFFKGVTGVLYYSNNNDYMTSYLHIEDLIKENHLVNKENIGLIKILNKVLLQKQYFNYLYHKTLTADEILYCIVHFNTHVEGTKKYVNIFETEELAEEYCMKKGTYGVNKDDFPITTIVNSVLYHAISKLKDKVDFIVLHSKDKKYKVKVEDFIYLITNVGFEQLNLD